ncbi:MAG: DivIVA domain-containing protein [Actinomycetota bacterium]|nr:DivIVA domain-containing protein [Actinomycetota bacterium]
MTGFSVDLGTLAGSDSVTATDIEDVSFEWAAVGHGYRDRAVDVFLDQVAREFTVVAAVLNLLDPAFPAPLAGRRGYDADEVDAFVVRVAAGDVELGEISFGPMAPDGRGYKESSVDAYVDHVVGVLVP